MKKENTEITRKRLKCEKCKGRGSVPIPGVRGMEQCKICLGRGIVFKIE